MDQTEPIQFDIRQAREDFIQGRRVKPGVVRREILESWHRSKALGIDPNMTRLPDALNEAQVADLLERNHLLISCARDILKNFFQLLKDADSVMLLLDRNAHMLEMMGAGPNWKKFNQEGNIKIGTCFQEKYCGTTPAALSLRHDKPFEISDYEYFSQIWQSTRDYSAPIHDEQGQIVGTIELAVVKDKTTLNLTPTFALVVAIAGLIENQLQLMQAIEQKNFFSRSLAASMASLEEGLIVLGADNTIVHINPHVEKMLNVKLANIRNQRIDRLFTNKLLLSAINGQTRLVDQEVVLDESVKRQRYLVSTNPILSAAGKYIGLTLVFKEYKSIQTLIQRVAGNHAHHTFDDILGESPEIRSVIRIARRVAKNTSNILIFGESGSGKELVAQSIHNAGIGAAGPFMAINCAAFPAEMIESEIFGYEPGTFTGGLRQGKAGKLELANGGTLFLDEVNGMSLDMQVKLLRVLEEKQCERLGGHRCINLDVRIISATNQDLRERVTLGHFRSDLYYRLSVVEIQIPPLRQRKQDIGIYVQSFIQEMNRKLGRAIRGCSRDAMDYLMAYSWPGNVRELRNWIERAVNLAETDMLTADDFPSPMTAEAAFCPIKMPVYAAGDVILSDTVSSVERDNIKSALEKFAGDTAEASRHLGIGRTTLYRKIKKYNIRIARQVC